MISRRLNSGDPERAPEREWSAWQQKDGFDRPGQSNQHRKSSGKSQKDVL
jgi:hypothetical protein